MPNLSSAGRKAFLGSVQVAIRKGLTAVVNLWNGTIEVTETSATIVYADSVGLAQNFTDISLVVFPDGPWLEVTDSADLGSYPYTDSASAALQEPLATGESGVIYDTVSFSTEDFDTTATVALV